MKGKYCSVLLILILSGSVYLPAQTLADTMKIEEVSVLALRPLEELAMIRMPVDSLLLQMGQTGNLGELLSGLTPLYIKSAGPGTSSGISLRGTTSTHTQIIWNGMNINSLMRGDVDLSLLPVGFTDQIDVVYGGGSLLSSAGGLGGSVLLGNNADWHRQLGLSLALDYGSYNSPGCRAEVSGGSAKVWGRVRMAANRSDNNYTYYNYGISPHRLDTLENASYEGMNAMQELYIKAGDGILALRIWEQMYKRDLPQLITSTGSDQKLENQSDRNFISQLEYRLYRDRNRFTFGGGYRNQQLSYLLSAGTDQLSGERYINNDSEGTEERLFGRFEMSHRFNRNLQLSTTVDMSLATVNMFDSAVNVMTGYNERRSEQSLLLDLRFRPAPGLAGFLLNRTQRVDGQLVPLIPSAGMEFLPIRKLPLLLKTGLSRNFRFPALNDLYWIPGGNPDLVPEKGLVFDASLEVDPALLYQPGDERQGPAFRFVLGGYYMVIHDWIEWRPGARAYYWEPVNIGLVHSRGIDVKADWRKNISGNCMLKLSAYYAYTRATNEGEVSAIDQSRGEQLIYIPVHKGGLNGELNLRAFHFRLSLPYTGRINTSTSVSEDETGYLPQASSYVFYIRPVLLVNTSVGTTLGKSALKVDLDLRVRNLLNTPYVAVQNRPAPGRWIYLSARFRYERRRDA